MSPQRKKKPNQCDMLKVDTDWLKKTSIIWRLKKVCQNKRELYIAHKKI